MKLLGCLQPVECPIRLSLDTGAGAEYSIESIGIESNASPVVPVPSGWFKLTFELSLQSPDASECLQMPSNEPPVPLIEPSTQSIDP